MRFSVIVPVYQVEPYIAKCLDSILPALGKEDEVILSLGKSTDNSDDICQLYADNDSRVSIIWQDGKGLSNARNCAVGIATGDYVLYADSDDYVNTKMLKKLLDRMRAEKWRQDVVVTDFVRFQRKNGKIQKIFQIGEGNEFDGMENLPKMLRRRQCFWNVWRYVYRREFLTGNNIIFRENMLSEDLEYTTKVLVAAKTIRFTHNPFYVYTVGRSESLMGHPDYKRLGSIVEMVTESIDYLKESHFCQGQIVTAQYQFEYILNLALIWEIDPSKRKKARTMYKGYKDVLAESSDKVVNFMLKVMQVFGINTVSYILHILKIIKRTLRNI